jgi:hypothetical protein
MPRWVLLVTAFAAVAFGQAPPGWRLGGGGIPDHYEVSLDKQVKRSGQASAHMRSKTDQPGVKFGNLLQIILADEYRGKRVRLTGYIRTAGNEDGAWMWLRADAPTMSRLDNMGDRLIKHASDWRRAEIVMDVPEDAQALVFGFALFGKGEIWADDVFLEVVRKNVPTTTTLPDYSPPDDEARKRRQAFEKNRATMQKTLTNAGFDQ